MKVGYLGPEGTFTNMATAQAFPNEELIAFSSIPACIKAVQQKSVEVALVPIENTIEGTVNTTLDYLYFQSTIPVGAEVVLPIAQQFMVHKSNKDKIGEIKKILSHPQALAQSQGYILRKFPDAEIENTASTSYAAQHIAHHPEKIYGAIAPMLSADTYDLYVVDENIQDIELNKTRFWVIGKKSIELDLPKKIEKVSLGISMPNNLPGALHKALSTFAWRNINLSKIESRPLKTTLGEYFFLVDIIKEQPLDLLRGAIEEIKLLGGEVKILGRYIVYEEKV